MSPTTTSAASSAACDEPLRAGFDEQRLGGYAEGALCRERGAREQAAGVAVDLSRAGEAERNVQGACEPGAELDRRPVVLGSSERHEHGPGGQCVVAGDEHADVARSRGENGAGRRIVERRRDRRAQEEVDVLLRRKPDESSAASAVVKQAVRATSSALDEPLLAGTRQLARRREVAGR